MIWVISGFIRAGRNIYVGIQFVYCYYGYFFFMGAIVEKNTKMYVPGVLIRMTLGRISGTIYRTVYSTGKKITTKVAPRKACK